MLQEVIYLNGGSEYHHPVFALMQMAIVRQQSSGSQSSSTISGSRKWLTMLGASTFLAVKLAHFLASHARRRDLPVYPSVNIGSTVEDIVKSSIPTFPGVLPPATGCVIPSRDRKLCPLCRSMIFNPCVSTGGYLFCYRCLIEYLKATPKCPVTNLRCNENDIIRLYEDND